MTRPGADADVADIVRARGIAEVLHFTTSHGFLGMAASGAVKSRARLPRETYLEYIFEPNALLRKDSAWLDYVNLSIDAINGVFFDVCANKWHRGEDLFWVVLAFDPVVLSHRGVVFVTTNNMYTGAKREEGVAGLEAMYAPRIVQWSGQHVERAPQLSKQFPTDEQAEVLYPAELGTTHLKTVYVESNHAYDVAAAQLALFPHEHVNVVLDPLLRRRNE